MQINEENMKGLRKTQHSKHDYVKKTKNGWYMYYDYCEACKVCGKPYLKDKHAFDSFCSTSCRNKFYRERPHMKRKKWDNGNGYLVNQFNKKVRYIHRDIAEKALGRKLKINEIVHHINMDKLDNRNCNLLICDPSYHQWLHNNMAKAWVEVVGL